jgi:hypothetical protein
VPADVDDIVVLNTTTDFPEMTNVNSAGDPIDTPYPGLDRTKYRDADQWNELVAHVKTLQEAVQGIKTWLVGEGTTGPFPFGFPSHGTLQRYCWDFWAATGASNTHLFASNTSGAGASVATTYAALSTSELGGTQLDTGTDTTGFARSRMGGNIPLGALRIRTRHEVYIPTLSDGTNTFGAVVGLGDADTLLQTDGAYFLHDRSISTTNWICRTVSNSVSTGTQTDTGVAINTAAHQTLEVEVNAAGTQVRYWINGVLVATHSANIPTSTSRTTGVVAGLIVKSAGTTSRSLRVRRCAGEILLPAAA